MSGCGYVLQVGIAKTWARILLKLLSGVFNLEETHTTRVVLIFSQSWSSHGLEVCATDDPRRVATKLTIKVCRFRAYKFIPTRRQKFEGSRPILINYHKYTVFLNPQTFL